MSDECEHTRLRCWASWLDTSGKFIHAAPVPGGPPRASMVRREAAAVWCPKCSQRWGFPRDPEDDVVPSARASGEWSIHLMPDASLTVESTGTLTEAEADLFATALREARGVAADFRDQLADRARWIIEDRKGQLVLSRYLRGRRMGVVLAPVTPRKPVTCDLCETMIPSGQPAWKGTSERPPIGHEVQGAPAFRVCAGCVRNLAPEPTPAAPIWPVRGLEC